MSATSEPGQGTAPVAPVPPARGVGIYGAHRTGAGLPLPDRIADCADALATAARSARYVVSGDGRVSEPDAATLLGIAAGTMRNWRNGRAPVPFYKTGGRVTYRLSDLAVFIEKAREDW